MKYIDEYRDPQAARKLARLLEQKTTRPWTLMEVCGGQTHSILKFGVDQLLPEGVTLLHGPGCPVCVTPLEKIEMALSLAQQPGVILCSFGDMLRVPGVEQDLLSVKARGADVRMVYSPLDALEPARRNPDREIVFFAVGFETTAPANAAAVYRAAREELKNFSVLVSQVRVPPAIEAILSDPENRVDGFLAAGHVCTVMGFEEYEPIAGQYRTPIVVTGFEPVDLLHGMYRCISLLEEDRFEVENAYGRAVRREGNRQAREIMGEVFRIVPQKWRGIGEIPMSGLSLQESYRFFDAESRFGLKEETVPESEECLSGQVLQGKVKPPECPAFGIHCTPDHPMGATMVSSEGACAAYFRYRKKELKRESEKI